MQTMEIYEGEQGLIYDRKLYCPWVFVLEGIQNEDEFEGIFRTAWSDGRECERFSLMHQNADQILVQINIFKNKDYYFWCTAPCSIYMDWKKKHILIKLLCEIEVTGEHDVLISTNFADS